MKRTDGNGVEDYMKATKKEYMLIVRQETANHSSQTNANIMMVQYWQYSQK
jgi:hypothetical protein